MPKLKIYLADLDHFIPGNLVTVPLNIGCIASYCKSIYGNNVDIFLFRHPMELMEEIRHTPPNILGLSFYMWNFNLCLKVIECCKKISPSILTVVGGPSAARITDYFKTLLINNPSLDIVALDYGEKSFANIVNRVLSKGISGKSVFSESIAGCALRLGNDAINRGAIENDIKTVNETPSPYLTGYLDKFIEKGFLSLLETNRGCPYSCAFCDQADLFYSKLAIRDEDIIYEELRYLQKHSKSNKLCIIDSNFGLLGDRDLRISAFMLDLYKKTGFPFITDRASSMKKTKTSIQTMVNVSKITGDLYFGLQTLTPEVLNNTSRKNIPIDVLKDLIEIAKKDNLSVLADLIFGLPGETVESFMKTLSELIDMGLERMGIYQLRLLPGTEISENMRKKNKYVSKFRAFNNRFGEYEFMPGEQPTRIIETEEIAVQSASFDFNDFMAMREYSFLVALLMEYRSFSETIFYLSSRKINITEIIKTLLENHIKYSELKALFDNYRKYSEKELFNSEEELINGICRNDDEWNDLLSCNGNYFKINLGFVGYCLFENVETLDNIEQIIKAYVRAKAPESEYENLDTVLKYDKKRRIIQNKLKCRLKPSDIVKDLYFEEQFDYTKWKANNFSGKLTAHKHNKTIKKIYYIEKYDGLIQAVEKYSMMSNMNLYERILMYAPEVSLSRLLAIKN